MIEGPLQLVACKYAMIILNNNNLQQASYIMQGTIGAIWGGTVPPNFSSVIILLCTTKKICIIIITIITRFKSTNNPNYVQNNKSIETDITRSECINSFETFRMHRMDI